jgi:hypothetical protein
VRARHLHSKGCLNLIARRETLDESEGSIDTDLANPAPRKLGGSLQLVQRGSHKIAGASAKGFLQSIPPNPLLTIGRVKLGRVRDVRFPQLRTPTLRSVHVSDYGLCALIDVFLAGIIAPLRFGRLHTPRLGSAHISD